MVGSWSAHGRLMVGSWSAHVVDVARGQLLDVVPGRDAASSCSWFAEQPVEWMAWIRWAALDRSGLYRSAFDTVLAHERLDDAANAKLVGLLEAGDPNGEVRTAWHAKELVWSIYAIEGPELAGPSRSGVTRSLRGIRRGPRMARPRPSIA
jgi:hypothetical protein